MDFEYLHQYLLTLLDYQLTFYFVLYLKINGKSKKWLEVREAHKGMITECNLVSLTGSQNGKEILGKFSEIQIMCGI